MKENEPREKTPEGFPEAGGSISTPEFLYALVVCAGVVLFILGLRSLGMAHDLGGFYFLTFHAILLAVAGLGLAAAGFLFHMLHGELEEIKSKLAKGKK